MRKVIHNQHINSVVQDELREGNRNGSRDSGLKNSLRGPGETVQAIILITIYCSDLQADTMENSERDGNTRPPDLPLQKSVCRSGSSS